MRARTDLHLAPHRSVSRLWCERWFKVSLSYWKIEWSVLILQTVISCLRGGKGTLVWPGTQDVWIWRCWKAKLSHYLLPLLNKSSPLLSPSILTHFGSIPRSDLKLDCKDCIHISLAQLISLPLSSYTQPYFLDLFCALKSNFRNKCSQIPCGVLLFAWSYFSFYPSSLSLLLLIFVTHSDCFFLSVKTGKYDICWCWIRFYLQYHSTLSSL